jgi:hypothetical protein
MPEIQSLSMTLATNAFLNCLKLETLYITNNNFIGSNVSTIGTSHSSSQRNQSNLASLVFHTKSAAPFWITMKFILAFWRTLTCLSNRSVANTKPSTIKHSLIPMSKLFTSKSQFCQEFQAWFSRYSQTSNHCRSQTLKW